MKDSKILIYRFFILNLISDCAVIGVNHSLAPKLCIPFLAAFTTWLIWLVYAGLNSLSKAAGRAYQWILLTILNILIIGEYFLLFKFHTFLSQQSIDLLFGTNSSEAAEFISSYLPWWLAILIIVAIVAMNAGVYRLAVYLADKFEPRKIAKPLRRLMTIGGAAIVGYMLIIFVRYHHGAEIPTFTSFTRLGYGYFQRLQNIHRTDRLVNLCLEAEVTPAQKPDYDIIVVLGESYARHHTPLYGYDKMTTPGQMKLMSDSALVVFNDVVTIEDWTQKVMMSLFSTGRSNSSFGNHPLFPALLRKAGWRTEVFENEFPVSHDTFFFSRKDLSDIMFDYRDDNRTRYDAELADRMVPRDSATFHLLHLIGQHFQYIDRFPSERAHFTAADYDSARFNSQQRAILANYDNATLYNDSVFCSVVDRWADRDAVIIYFSDHGEEIYDCRDYFGHGNAISASDISYQIRIPFMIYGSAKFRANHPQIWQAITEASTRPITTDDFSHFILDLAQVNTPHFDPTRSFINPAYNPGPRTVLNSITIHQVN